MAELCEASAILKRLIERLHPYSTAEQQADIDSLQHILDSPLFRKLYNLQQSLQRLKTEYETGNQFIRNCLFDFDLNGHLQIIQNNIEANLSNIDNYDYLADQTRVRRLTIYKQTANDSLGIILVESKHHRLDIYAIFIAEIQANSLAAVNDQLHVGDQIVSINNIYFDSKDPTIVARARDLLSDSSRLLIELVVIGTSIDSNHAAVSKSTNDGHGCVPRWSTPSHGDMVLNTLWTQIEVIELINDGSGLGFGISGNKSTGVVVKAIVPGSIADKDGRLRTGDHLFQINHVCVRGMSSEQVAGILRQCSHDIRLVVARSVREPTTINESTMHSPPSMSKRPSITSDTTIKSISTGHRNSLTNSIEHDRMFNEAQNKILVRTERLLENNHNLEKLLENLHDQSHHEEGTEILDVTLEKGDDGLGITVAGYVSPDSTNNDAIAGIFIRDIAPDSVCARDGRLALGDQIIEVNEQSLNGFSNVQALYLLQNTSSSVRLKVRRYLDGLKYEKIKEMIAVESSDQIEEKFEFPSPIDIKEQSRQKWTTILGNNHEILVANIYKPENGGLGITLEGTVDIENGEEVRPHHYIRALQREGPIATEGTLRSGDELLEVNNQILYGKNHIQVIEILKRVKHQVILVCARRRASSIDESAMVNHQTPNSARTRSMSFGKTAEIVVKAKSMGTLNSNNVLANPLSSSTTRITDSMKSRSLEVISNLALWSTSIVHIELNKGDNGLGFSVLDYQDPSNPSYSPVIVIRALVPGGVAQLDGRLLPGDRLVAVNGITLENMNLDEVISILKSTPKGSVKLSVSKPLPYPKFKNEHEDKTSTDSDQDTNQTLPQQRSSRINKSQTTTAIVKHQQRSASSHRPSRSSSAKRAAVPVGIALSAPAILSQHEYMESLLSKENMRKKTEQRASSANRSRQREKISARFPSLERKENISQLTKESSSTSVPSKQKSSPSTSSTSPSHIPLNLPEFEHFQSDHLLLAAHLVPSPHHDRSRCSSVQSPSTKYHRSSTTTNANHNPLSSPKLGTNFLGNSPRTNYVTSKRLSRSRQTHDTTINHASPSSSQYQQQQQQQQPAHSHLVRPISLRQMTTKFDSTGSFRGPDLSSDDDQQQQQQSHHHHPHPHKTNNNHHHHHAVLSSSSSSSPLDHQYPIKNVADPSPLPHATEKTTATTNAITTSSVIDEDAHEVDSIIKQHQRTLTNNHRHETSTVITPTIKTPTTPTLTSKWTSSRQPSRMASPALSTSSQSSGRVITFLNHEVIQLPVYLEREIRVKQNFDQLGLIVDAYVDEGVNGCYVRSIAPSSTVAHQHILRPGDYILSINNENMKKISNAQARSVIRRASLIGSDISVIFIPGDEAKQFKEHTLDPQGVPSPIPPEIVDSDVEPTTTKPITTPTLRTNPPTTIITSTISNDGDSFGFDSQSNQTTNPTYIDSETLSATLWGPPRTVTLYRNEHVRSLGISIVGGKLDFSGPGNTIESCISGIFIKHVLPDSPAGRNGTLKTGDRILEVNGYDLREASHDRAVEIIRAAQSPVHFIVQSLLDPSNPTCLSNDESLLNDSSHIPTTSPSTTKSPSSSSKYSVSRERRTEEELIKQYGHLTGELLFVDIKRNPAEITEPLGLSLIGHRDPNKLAVFVCDIQPGSLLDRDHRIYPGDQLLEVNGEILLGKAHSAVTPIIKSIKADTLNFVVLRNPNAINDMALNNQHAVARIRASAMASPTVEHSSISSKVSRNPISPSTTRDSHDDQRNDASHLSHPIPGQSPDVNEQKENNDGLALTGIVSSIPQQLDISNDPMIDTEQSKVASEQEVQVQEEKSTTAEERGTSASFSSTSNRITAANDVQSNNSNNSQKQKKNDDNNNVDDVLSFNHNISSNATITAFHSISSDVSSPTRRPIATSFDQATSSAYENDESLLSQATPLLSSLLMHEQPNHANDQNREEKTMNNDNDDKKNNTEKIPMTTEQTNASTVLRSDPERKDPKQDTLPSRPSVIQSNDLASRSTHTASPSDVSTSSPLLQKTDDHLTETATTTTIKTTNGATAIHRPLTSSSSSSSSSLSVSTPSSTEHVTKNLSSVSSTPVPRRASMSNPGLPTTLILKKDQKGSFGLTVTQRDRAIWIQSVQPHGPADQQDIRAGDQLIQINGTPVEVLKLNEIQNMLEHSNSNQIHLTCVPYREPQPQPVVVNINQTESLPMMIPNETDSIREDDPRTRPVVVGQETLIEIDRGHTGLGLSVVGGSDTQLPGIIVHDIYDGCAAQRDGRLHVGDQILEVNSIDLRSATHEEAIQALRQSTNVVRILVLRGKVLTELTNEQDKFDLINIELIKKSGKGLGFSIIGRRHGHGVFISHILEGGCAEKDGRLMSGDLILEVNGQDLRTASYEHVAYTLKTLPHGRVTMKIGRLKPSARTQTRQNYLPHDRKNRSRSSSSNIRRSSANKVNDR